MELSLLGNNREACVNELTKLNETTQNYGLRLSPADIATLIQARDEALAETGRIEFGAGVLGKLAYALCDSPYVEKEDYLDTLCEMLRLFYHFKAQSMERAADEALIKAMVESYNTTCEGSLELLADTNLGKAVK